MNVIEIGPTSHISYDHTFITYARELSSRDYDEKCELKIRV